MFTSIIFLLLNQDIQKDKFDLIKQDKNKTFYAGEIRIGWQYDYKKRVYWKYQESSKNCLSGFR